MADYYDEGGAIPDDEAQAAAAPAPYYPTDTGDNSGAPPVVGPPPDNSGAVPVMPMQSQAPQQDQGGDEHYRPDFSISHAPGNAKRILQYLLGAGAAHPDVADKFSTAVKAEHPGTSDDDANLISILKAKEQGGDEAASALLQTHMQQYSAKSAFAAAALAGGQGKPPDPNAAAEAATQASKHMLDGSTAVFSYNPDSGNFTATVKYPHSDAHQNFSLTPEQFAEYEKPGGAGQWDQVLSGGGIASALTKLTQNSQAAPQGEDRIDQIRKQAIKGGQPNAAPPAADSDEDPADAKAAAKLDAQSRKMFPWISQEGQRQAWIAQQQGVQDKLQNNIDVKNAEGTFRIQTESEKNKGRIGAAQIRGSAQVEAAKQHAIAEASKQAAISGREGDRHRVKMFSTLLNNSNIASQADINRAAQAAGITLGSGQQAPGSPAPTQGAAPATGKRSFTGDNVPPAEQRQVGDVVNTPKGTFSWTGSGWQKQ